MVAASRHTPPPMKKEHHMTAPQILIVEVIKTIYETATGDLDEVYVVRTCTSK